MYMYMKRIILLFWYGSYVDIDEINRQVGWFLERIREPFVKNQEGVVARKAKATRDSKHTFAQYHPMGKTTKGRNLVRETHVNLEKKLNV